jgi:hypothetical protein
MAKVKPDTKKILKAIAEALPLKFYTANEHVEISGEDLILANHKHWYGQEIEKEKYYLLQTPAFYEVNHFRRLQETLKEQGAAGVFKYCEKLNTEELFEPGDWVKFRPILEKCKPLLA